MWGDCYCYYYVGRWRVIILRGGVIMLVWRVPWLSSSGYYHLIYYQERGSHMGKECRGNGTRDRCERSETRGGWWMVSGECLDGGVVKSDLRSLRRLLSSSSKIMRTPSWLFFWDVVGWRISSVSAKKIDSPGGVSKFLCGQ